MIYSLFSGVQDFHYCSGEVCHTPKELFDLLADDYRTYVEIELTKGKRQGYRQKEKAEAIIGKILLLLLS